MQIKERDDTGDVLMIIIISVKSADKPVSQTEIVLTLYSTDIHVTV